MKFEELNNTIPYAKGGKDKVLTYSPYPHVTIAMPGRHAKQTDPVGGDFVVMVSDPIFSIPNHQFTHIDIFNDVEKRKTIGGYGSLMGDYLEIIQGASPLDYSRLLWPNECINPNTFFAAVQCLAIAEHRRYAKFEPKFGGRYLPFRFAAGIDEGLWTAGESAALQKKGRPGVEMLENQRGVPVLTQKLMQ